MYPSNELLLGISTIQVSQISHLVRVSPTLNLNPYITETLLEVLKDVSVFFSFFVVKPLWQCQDF